MSIFTDLFSTKPAEEAAAAQKAGYQAGQSAADSLYNTALTNSNNLYGQAYQPFSQLYTQAQPGMSAYADASGANGAAGLARAKALYQADPGYNGGLTTGIDQVMRTAAARGDLGGGNTSADLVKFASDYDNQKYNQYVSGLAPWLSAGNSAAAGGASVLGSQAGADNSIYGARANTAYNSQVGQGNAQAQADLAPYSASSNFWNAALGVGKLALSAATGMPMGGGSTPLSPGSSIPGSFGATSVGGANGPTPLSGGSFFGNLF